jgi:CDP-paratose 2-epimerase
VSDLVLAQAADFGRFAGSIFNAGGGLDGSLSLRECTDLCRDLTGNSVEIAPAPQERPADVRIFLTDSRHLMSRSSWQPSRNARTTLCDIFQWMRANERQLRPVLAGTA